MKDLNLLSPDTKNSFFRYRDDEIKIYFFKAGDLVYSNNFPVLMNLLNYEYDPNHWQLFFDFSKTSLKAGLVHNGNKLP